MAKDEVESINLRAESIYGANTRKGPVKLTFQTAEVICSPDEARMFALSVLEVAEAAETDELFMSFLNDKISINDERAILILRDFRKSREAKKQERLNDGRTNSESIGG